MTRSQWLLASLSALIGLVAGQMIPIPMPGEVRPAEQAATRSSRPEAKGKGEIARPVASGGSAETAVASFDQLESDFRRLWGASMRAGDKDIDREVQALMELAAVDPYRAVSLAMKLEGPNATKLLVRLIESMKLTSQHALRALLENPKWKGEWQVVNAIFGNLAAIDPRMAWEEATKDGRTFVDQAVFEIGTEWAKKTPRDAVTFAMGITDRDLRKRLTDAVFSEWISKKPDDFIAWLRSVPNRESWSDVIPWQNAGVKTKEQFLALAEIFPEKLPGAQMGISSPMGFFKSPEMKDEYLSWISAMPEGARRDVALTSLAKAMLMWNPEDALPLLPSVKDASSQTQITSAVAASRAAGSPADGIAFADSLQGDARSLALRSVVSTWAETDPAGAAAFIATRSDELNKQMDDVVGLWAKHDPQAAASFALGQKDAGVAAGVAENFNYGLRSAMSTWVNQDAYAASAWVTNMPVGQARDIATDALAGAAMNVDPDGALGWAMSISDPAMRQRCIRDCVTSWLWRDGKSAAAWVDSANIDEKLRAELSAAVAKQGTKSKWTSSISDSTRTVFY